MAKWLRFTLPKGMHTWAVRRDDPRVLISGHIVDGAQLPYDDVHDADGYVLRGQAEIVEVGPKVAEPKPETGPAASD
ncbi:MAG TPA: hypothetical protein PKK95_02575 [Vicinamibacterales bacterium]|nr:hypothetical protein [Vicinamibacterales bacterium]HQL55483.1 hypothetical protein [Phycisphaerae bacterium]